MNELKDWSCDFKIDTRTQFTVGDKFGILCKGQTPLQETDQVLVFPNEGIKKYNFYILRKKFKSEYELFLSATSWKVGSHNLKNHELVVGDNVIALKGPQINVKTVMTKKMKEPNKPPGPILTEMGMGFFILIGVLLFSGLSYLFYIYNKSRRFDKGLLKLHGLKTSTKPFFQFQKDFRSYGVELDKSNLEKIDLINLAKEMQKSLVNYFSLDLNLPLFNLSPKEQRKYFLRKKLSLKIIKGYFELLKEYGSLIKDLSKLDSDKKKNQTKILNQDLNGIFESSIELANDFMEERLRA